MGQHIGESKCRITHTRGLNCAADAVSRQRGTKCLETLDGIVEVGNDFADALAGEPGERGRERAEAASRLQCECRGVGNLMGARVRHVVVYAPPSAVREYRRGFAGEGRNQFEHRIAVTPRGALATEVRGDHVTVAHHQRGIAEYAGVQALQHAPAASVVHQQGAIDQAVPEWCETGA
jgi:hypothetical protein